MRLCCPFIKKNKFLPYRLPPYRVPSSRVSWFRGIGIGVLFAVAISILLQFPCPVSGRAAAINSIVIDPGHGGEDTGCVGFHGTMEKDITLQLAKRLSEIIQERLGVEAVLTRRGDYHVDLVERTGIANNSRADMFISLHANSTFSPGQSGHIMIFIAPGLDGEDVFKGARGVLWDQVQRGLHNESFRLSSLIAEETRKSGLWREAVIKNAPILVLKGANIPAVEVEIDFLTSSKGEERLRDRWSQKKICEVLYRAIIRFGSTLEKDPNAAEW